MEITPAPRNTCRFRLELTNENFAKVNGLPGFYKWAEDNPREIIFRPTSANVAYIIKHFPAAIWTEGTHQHIADLDKRDKIAAEIRAGKLHLDIADEHEYKTKPYDHQRKAFLLSRDRDAFALLMEQRTGKTKVIIDNAAYLWKLGKVHTLIIVTVNGVHRNWVDNEIPKHMPDWCPYKAYFHRSAHTKAQKNLFEEILSPSKNLKIFSFYFEAFSAGSITEMFQAVLGSGSGVMLAIDESTRIKTRTSTRSKFLIKHGAKADYRRILTGSPIVKDPTDVFAQFLFLDPDILGYDTLTTFKQHFCIVRQFENKATGNTFEKIWPNAERSDELANLIDGYSFRVLRKDCMDLPPKVYKRRPVEMTPDQKRLYKELGEEYICSFQGSTVTAALAMTRAVRLQQILCNWWPMEESELIAGETWRKVKPISKTNPRLDALDDIIQSTDDQIIIWARFRPDLELIQLHLGRDAVSYHGGIKEEDRARNYKAFQEKRARFFVANPASAGLGLELSMAGTEVYYSNSYNLEHRIQSEDRAEGPYKSGATLIIDLECVGTQDTKIIRNLKGKKDVAEIIMRDPRSFFLEDKE